MNDSSLSLNDLLLRVMKLGNIRSYVYEWGKSWLCGLHYYFCDIEVCCALCVLCVVCCVGYIIPSVT